METLTLKQKTTILDILSNHYKNDVHRFLDDIENYRKVFKTKKFTNRFYGGVKYDLLVQLLQKVKSGKIKILKSESIVTHS